jgi:hypothetical protein
MFYKLHRSFVNIALLGMIVLGLSTEGWRSPDCLR